MKITLKKRLIIISTVSVLIPLLIFASAFYIMGSKLLVNDFKQRSIENLYLVDQAVNLYIEKIKHTVNTISNIPAVQHLNTNDLRKYQYYSEKTEMTPYKNTAAEKNIYEYLKLVHINNPDLGAVYIGTDSGGFTMHPPSHRRPYYNPSERPWYKEAMELQGQLTITSPFKSSDKNYNIFAVAKQVYFPKNKEFGVVSVNIELDTITNILEQLNIGKTGFVILTKKDNTILANPVDPTINFKNLASPEIDKSYNQLTQLGTNWDEITFNQKKYIAKRYYSVGTDWLFYFLITKSELLQPLNKMLIIMIILSTLIITIFTPLAALSAVKSLIPLEKLNKHLLNLSKGNADLNKRISIYSNDEVGETIDNFNLLSEKLNNLFIDMKKTTDTISANISDYSTDMLIASTEIEKTKIAVQSSDEMLNKISELISSGQEENSLLTGKTGKIKLDKLFADLLVYFEDLKEHIEDIKSSYKGINNSIEISIDHCRDNKIILKDIRQKISTYKTRPAAE
jgi:methyl-accepting chemotaxis protein